MTYLLDVNALLALGIAEHEFHDRVRVWIRQLDFPRLATCSITELGFVRILAQAPAYGFSVSQARVVLYRLKSNYISGFDFVIDDQDISHFPSWVKTPKQTTDGHLISLATARGSQLATLHNRIPGAYLIPEKTRR